MILKMVQIHQVGFVDDISEEFVDQRLFFRMYMKNKESFFGHIHLTGPYILQSLYSRINCLYIANMKFSTMQ